MQIDWITVAAQIANFLLLVYLLQRFLYRPILNAMDRREGRISARLTEAERLSAEAEQEAESFRRKQQELEHARADILAATRVEADDLRKAMRDDVIGDIEETRAQWLRQVRQEKAEFMNTVRARTARQFIVVARRALADLADAELEERIVETFIKQLGQLDKDKKTLLAESSHDEGDSVVVASGFKLPPHLKANITRAVREHVDPLVRVSFAPSAEIDCGIELTIGGHLVSWSLASYLDAFEDSVGVALHASEQQSEIG